jgi:hypothetical protein
LKHDALVVDVGGGIGSQSMTLAQNYSHLRFVIQDREPVLKDAVMVRDSFETIWFAQLYLVLGRRTTRSY